MKDGGKTLQAEENYEACEKIRKKYKKYLQKKNLNPYANQLICN